MLPLLLLTTSAALLGGSGRPLARHRSPTPACSASEDLHGRLKDALSEAPGEASAEAFRLALTSVDADLSLALRPLVGVALAPRVADLAHSPGFVTAPPPLGLFELRASELMAAERWLEAHDVVAGELLDAEAEAGLVTHAHDALLAARLLEGICQHELACTDGLAAALEAHAADVATPLACGCAVSTEAVEPFADLAAAVAAMRAGDASTALGHALASGLGRASLAPVAARIAQRAVLAIEPGSLATEVSAADAALRTTGGSVEEAAVDAGAAPGGEDEFGGAAAGLPALAALERLVGLGEAREHCRNLVDAIALEKERGDDPKQPPAATLCIPGCNPVYQGCNPMHISGARRRPEGALPLARADGQPRHGQDDLRDAVRAAARRAQGAARGARGADHGRAAAGRGRQGPRGDPRGVRQAGDVGAAGGRRGRGAARGRVGPLRADRAP